MQTRRSRGSWWAQASQSANTGGGPSGGSGPSLPFTNIHHQAISPLQHQSSLSRQHMLESGGVQGVGGVVGGVELEGVGVGVGLGLKSGEGVIERRIDELRGVLNQIKQ